MHKKIVVLISGPHGTGKTTIAKAIAERLSLRYVSAGNIFRNKAKEMGMSIVEFTKYVEKHPEIDYEIDEHIKKELLRGDAVFDSQLAYYFAKFLDETFIKVSIMIYASLEERIRRVMERENISYEEAAENIKAREESEQERFKRLYGVKLWRIDDFDVIINTTGMAKENAINFCVEVVEKLIKLKLKSKA